MMKEVQEDSDSESMDNVSINEERKELMRQVSIRSKESVILKRSLSELGIYGVGVTHLTPKPCATTAC